MKKENDVNLDYALSLSESGEIHPKGCYKCMYYSNCTQKFTSMNCAFDEAILRMRKNSLINS